MKQIISKSSSATKKIAKDLGDSIAASKPGRHAAVIALAGDLGAGKTTFVQGFAKVFDIKQKIVSPTFLIFRVYKLPKNLKIGFKRIYHVDLYRIHAMKELEFLGFQEILNNPENIVLIEWADRIKRSLPKKTIWLSLEHGKNINERLIKAEYRGN